MHFVNMFGGLAQLGGRTGRLHTPKKVHRMTGIQNSFPSNEWHYEKCINAPKMGAYGGVAQRERT